MPSFSARSRANLETCHEDLQRLFGEVIKHYDCTILCGHRGEEEQNEAFRQGRSQLQFPQSKHNSLPSIAVDVAPYPIDWDNRSRFYHFGGLVLGISIGMGIPIRWGGDWDMDTDLNDQSFFDLPHFELKL